MNNLISQLFHQKNKFLKAFCLISAILNISLYEIATVLFRFPLLAVHIHRLFAIFCRNNGQTILFTQFISYWLYHTLPVSFFIAVFHTSNHIYTIEHQMPIRPLLPKKKRTKPANGKFHHKCYPLDFLNFSNFVLIITWSSLNGWIILISPR